MRSVKIEHAYKKDFRREARGENIEAMATELPLVIAALAADIPLSPIAEIPRPHPYRHVERPWRVPHKGRLSLDLFENP
jgi:mRNA-degrading endonuclease YafQ of YafQ-DinJ toxin-antitoxin module